MRNQHQIRRIKLIQPSIQMQLIWGFGAVSVIAITCQALVFAAVMTRYASGLPEGGGYIVAGLPRAQLIALGASFLLIVPSLMVIGVRLTFRIAGPLYRMEQHLRSVAAGDAVELCAIRKEDELQEFCVLLNDALRAAEERGRLDSSSGGQRAA